MDTMKQLQKKNMFFMLALTVMTLLLGAASTASAQSVEESLPLNEVGWIVLYGCIIAIAFAIYFVLKPQKKEKKLLPYAVVLLLFTVVLAIVFWLIDLASYGSFGIAWWNYIGLTFWGWMLYLLVSLGIFLVTVVAIYTLVKDKEEKMALVTGVAAWILWTVIIWVCSVYLTYAPLFT